MLLVFFDRRLVCVEMYSFICKKTEENQSQQKHVRHSQLVRTGCGGSSDSINNTNSMKEQHCAKLESEWRPDIGSVNA